MGAEGFRRAPMMQQKLTTLTRTNPTIELSRPIAILLKNLFELKIHDEVKDTLGNYIILIISIQDYRMAVSAVYELNEDKLWFFETLQSKINIFLNSIGM
jgi:hypothetical protein